MLPLLNASLCLTGPKAFLIGTSVATPEILSELHNSLIMDGKLSTTYPLDEKKGPFSVEIWGKSLKELRRDTQFVRFLASIDADLLTLNNMQMDEKELKMQTKGQVPMHLSSS